MQACALDWVEKSPQFNVSPEHGQTLPPPPKVGAVTRNINVAVGWDVCDGISVAGWVRVGKFVAVKCGVGELASCVCATAALEVCIMMTEISLVVVGVGVELPVGLPKNIPMQQITTIQTTLMLIMEMITFLLRRLMVERLHIVWLFLREDLR